MPECKCSTGLAHEVLTISESTLALAMVRLLVPPWCLVDATAITLSNWIRISNPPAKGSSVAGTTQSHARKKKSCVRKKVLSKDWTICPTITRFCVVDFQSENGQMGLPQSTHEEADAWTEQYKAWEQKVLSFFWGKKDWLECSRIRWRYSNWWN